MSDGGKEKPLSLVDYVTKRDLKDTQEAIEAVGDLDDVTEIAVCWKDKDGNICTSILVNQMATLSIFAFALHRRIGFEWDQNRGEE